MEGELESLEVQIAELQQRQKRLTKRRDALLQQLGEACDVAQPSSSKSKSSQSAAVMSKQELQRYDNAGTGKDPAPLSSGPASCGFNLKKTPTNRLPDFPWSKDVDRHLKASFHLMKFRPMQLRAINLSMSGKDVFLVMPTGRGKSLCYQLPAATSKGESPPKEY